MNSYIIRKLNVSDYEKYLHLHLCAFYTLEDLKPPLAVQSSRATLPINELKRALRVQI